MTPVSVTITHSAPRWWHALRRGRFVIEVPGTWDEVKPRRRRQRWWRWIMALPRPAAQRRIVADLLSDLPWSARQRLSDLDRAGLALLLEWANASPDCETVPLPHFTHKGVMYHFPKPKGSNMTCIEFPMADEYYQDFIAAEKPDQHSLMCLLATLVREQNPDPAEVLRMGDARVALYSREEVEARASRLAGLPPEYCLQALLWFAGMKKYVHRVYGAWLFDSQDDEEEEEDEVPQKTANTGPNFGWWGIYQSVAESGVFGNLGQVHQAAFHDVCVYLVRKRVEAEQHTSAVPAAGVKHSDDE